MDTNAEQIKRFAGQPHYLTCREEDIPHDRAIELGNLRAMDEANEWLRDNNARITIYTRDAMTDRDGFMHILYTYRPKRP